ncbi:DMT family transporter [Marinomonas sp. E8]|uniref:DMT family transporter n=2 Tax=Marinomonas algarum TaxID=2883105 RepID=A0A9X1IPF3_9GAMM|nr:DMT family transporter [Marinomonas algarum]MCB5162737.1 DMT family transporter [Marinomonas algarum]
MTNLLRLCSLIALALLAFAANSVLCRLALSDGLIDPASFTVVRLLSGAFTLGLLCGLQSLTSRTDGIEKVWSEGSWLSAIALFVYATGFSYAYVTLETGVGALILFGAVQLTLIVLTMLAGQKLAGLEWLGLVIAFMGFAYLVLPTLSSPSLVGFILMSVAGVAWGLYTWRGKRSTKPLFATTSNFVRTLPMLGLVLLVVSINKTTSMQMEGVGYALVSGALMSGLGYALWYAVLPYLSASLSAVLQLLVPVIATIGGVIFANESITLHLVIATSAVLGGVMLVILGKKRPSKNA